MPGEIPTPASGPVKNSGALQVFLPKEAFKGILRYPGRVERLSAGVDEGATALGTKLHGLCLEIPASRFEPIVVSLRQTLRVDR
jgi:hypothetical protein